jgi:hypothetical protein
LKIFNKDNSNEPINEKSIKEEITLFRHGDLLIKKINSIPKECKKLSTNILAEGEVTGHHHKLNGSFQIFQNSQKVKFIETFEQVRLTHQEHSQLLIPKGVYVVVEEREFDPLENLQLTNLDPVRYVD